MHATHVASTLEEWGGGRGQAEASGGRHRLVDFSHYHYNNHLTATRRCCRWRRLLIAISETQQTATTTATSSGTAKQENNNVIIINDYRHYHHHRCRRRRHPVQKYDRLFSSGLGHAHWHIRVIQRGQSQARPSLALPRAWCCNWSCTPDSKSNVSAECALPARNMQFCTFRTIIFTHWGDHNRVDVAAVYSLYMESSKCTNIASSAAGWVEKREECSYRNTASCNNSRRGNEMSCDNRMIERWYWQ